MSKTGKADNKSIHDKLKSFFKFGNSSLGNGSGGGGGGGKVLLSRSDQSSSNSEEYTLTCEAATELSADGGGSVQSRLKLIRELTVVAEEQRLERGAVELIWIKTKDLLLNDEEVEKSEETRGHHEDEDEDHHAAGAAASSSVERRRRNRHRQLYQLYEAIIRGQYSRLDIVRTKFFRLIKESPALDTAAQKQQQNQPLDPDLASRIYLLDALTDNGKDILHLETEIGPLLVRLFPHIIAMSAGTANAEAAENEAAVAAASAAATLDAEAAAVASEQPADNGGNGVHDNLAVAASSFDLEAKVKVPPVFLQLLLNMIKFNSAYLDPEVIVQLIDDMSQMCLVTLASSQGQHSNITGCLKCLDAILCYAYIPKVALKVYIYILCVLVNMEAHCAEAWRITRNLMGTHLGHSALYTLCQIIQGGGGGDVALVRGAVFFVGMSLWGNQRVQSLDSYSPMTILPTFLNAALVCTHHLVIYEMTLQTERLVTKYGHVLRATGCDAVLALVQVLLQVIPAATAVAAADNGSLQQQQSQLQINMTAHVHNIITCLESLAAEKKYIGSQHLLYDVIEQCSVDRSESSVIRLITYRASGISPTKKGWLTTLRETMTKHYAEETRLEVRRKSLQVLMQVYKSNRQIHEEEILEEVVIPLTQDRLDQEPDPQLRLETVKTLVSICMDATSTKCLRVLDVLEKVAMRPVTCSGSAAASQASSQNLQPLQPFEDVASVVIGLINLISTRICHQPAFIIVRAIDILIRYLEANYDHPELFSGLGLGSIREQVFRLIMRMRTDDNFHLGIDHSSDPQHGGKVHFSPFILCQQQQQLHPAASTAEAAAAVTPPAAAAAVTTTTTTTKLSSPSGVTSISLTQGCRMVIRCLREERDWQVLKLVLSRVPDVLQNKAMLARYGQRIQELVVPLIELTRHNSPYPECLVNVGQQKLYRTEFHNHVYPVLAAMAPYNEYLTSATARPMVTVLQNGLLSKESNKICIVALTACALEMNNSMFSIISNLLLNLSKISPTKSIATPMLEFLSTLIRLPELYKCFIDINFMSVFAIALPYTNPFKFDAYTVALAHHVIVMWFLKCRLVYRQGFVKFIINGLNNNVLMHLENNSTSSSHSADTDFFRKQSMTVTSMTAARAAAAGSSAAVAASKAAARIRNAGGGGGLAALSTSSGDGQRSSSFSTNSSGGGGDHGGRTKERHATGTATPTSSAPFGSSSSSSLAAKDQKRIQFHQELTETCIDFLARYMFANPSVHPRRVPTADFLLKGGQKAHWILASTMILTITTSVCDVTLSRQGDFCDRCKLICKANKAAAAAASSKLSEDEDKTAAAASSNNSIRSRHTSETQQPSPTKSAADFASAGAFSSSSAAAAAAEGGKKGVGGQRGDMCACWCTGWAEIHVRRPSGDTSWMCRVQNASLTSDSHGDFPLADLSALFHSSLEPPPPSATAAPSAGIDSSNSNDAGGSSSEETAAKAGNNNRNSSEEDSGVSSGGGSSNLSRAHSADDTSAVNAASTALHSGATAATATAAAAAAKCDAIFGGGAATAAEVTTGKQLALPPRSNQQDGLKAATSTRSLGSGGGGGSIAGSNSALANSSGGGGAAIDRRQSVVPSGLSSSSAAAAAAATAGMRDGAHTVSGHSPARRPPNLQLLSRPVNGAAAAAAAGLSSPISEQQQQQQHKPEQRVTGISPQFVFLTLYHTYCLGGSSPFGESLKATTQSDDMPILVPPNSKSIEMSIRNLDMIHAHETHKVGVIYIGKDQPYVEEVVLKNQFGSLRYAEFLQGLGTLISLRDAAAEAEANSSSTYFLGGLDADDGDGDFTYLWEDDVMQVVYHVATLMPNRESDPKCTKKQRHIGNNYVTIVYNDREGGRYAGATQNQPYPFNMIRGQFNSAAIVITPLDQRSNRVEIKCKPELNDPLGHVKEPKTVSDRNLGILVRQMALHCNLAAQIQQSLSSAANRDPYASNWLERLRAIKRIRNKVIKEKEAAKVAAVNSGVGTGGGGSGSGTGSVTGGGTGASSGRSEQRPPPDDNDFTVTVLHNS